MESAYGRRLEVSGGTYPNLFVQGRGLHPNLGLA